MYVLICVVSVFFFKQKTAYEMRISDWSSDVCSSDLPDAGQREQDVRDLWKGEGCRIRRHRKVARDARLRTLSERPRGQEDHRRAHEDRDPGAGPHEPDRKSVVSGKSVAVRVDLGGRRTMRKKLQTHDQTSIP